MSRSSVRLALVALVATAAGCDKVALLAPTGSTVTLSISTTSIGANGTAEVIATVIEAAGTPVHNGTEVTFQASVGKVDPPVARTENGLARTTFLANGASGTARIIAFSGGAAAEAVEIRVGGAAVETITVRTEPSSLPVTGGPVEVTATAVDASGNPVTGAPVVFSANAGTLNPQQVSTDANGQARTTLTTTRETRVTATVAGKTAETTVSVLAQPTITVTPNPASPIVGMPVTFTITPATTAAGSAIRTVTFDPGDGSGPRNLGVGTTSFAHVYSRAGTYTARAVATDVSGQTGESVTVLQAVRVLPTVTITPPTSLTGTVPRNSATFTINSSPGTGGPPIESVRVSFNPSGGSHEVGGPGQRTLTVTFASTGTHTATATVYDTAGTSATTQIAFVVAP
ncbi:MAG TPA: Ig-like domain-containing protein [Vicinamibacterales bacterium]|nr:Ig-like domain-containing protein [Vicinamibacterales bacterium]